MQLLIKLPIPESDWIVEMTPVDSHLLVRTVAGRVFAVNHDGKTTTALEVFA